MFPLLDPVLARPIDSLDPAGVVSLSVFAWLLTLSRANQRHGPAVYGGIYVVASLG